MGQVIVHEIFGLGGALRYSYSLLKSLNTMIIQFPLIFNRRSLSKSHIIFKNAPSDQEGLLKMRRIL